MRSVIAVVIVIAGMSFGCQSPVPTMPFDGQPTYLLHESRAVAGNELQLRGTLRDPVLGMTFEIEGIVVYNMWQVQQNIFDLVLVIDARLYKSESDQPEYSIEASTNRRVYVSEEGVAFLETRYLLRDDRLALRIGYQITQHNVEVIDIALEYVE